MSENQTIFSFNGPSKLWNKLPQLSCHECTILFHRLLSSETSPKKNNKKTPNKQKQQKANKIKRIKVDCSTIKVLSTERRP